MQGYDFHGSWEARANQQSALRVPRGAPDNPDFSVENTIDAWRDRGAPGSKLVLGIPYYGQGWTGITSGGNGLFGPVSDPTEVMAVTEAHHADPVLPRTRDRQFHC